MNAPIDAATGNTAETARSADAALSPTHPLWALLFPEELTPHHGLIAHKLRLTIAADIDLGADLNALLAKDGQWPGHSHTPRFKCR